MNKLTIILCFSILSSFAVAGEFSIDQEFQTRRLSNIFEKKYDMKVKVKRAQGKLLVKIWDQNFFVDGVRMTKRGAEFVRKLSHYLCKEEDQCGVLVESHHFENGYVSKSKVAKAAQYKMTSVVLQVLNAGIAPMSLTQKLMGDSSPYVSFEKNLNTDSQKLNELNSRVEITFQIKKDKI